MLENQEGRMSPLEQAEFDKAATGHREQPFLPDSAKDVLSDKTPKILEFKKPAHPQSPESEPLHEISDKAQKYINRLEEAKSEQEAINIINEAISDKGLTYFEESEILNHGMNQAA
jgi:hypothetical protein